MKRDTREIDTDTREMDTDSVAERDGERKKPREIDIGPLIFLLFLCVLIPLGFKYYNAFHERRSEYTAKQEEEKKLQKKIAEMESKINEMKETKKHLETDAGVEEVARNKLGMIKPREIPFVVTPSRKDSPVDGSEEEFMEDSVKTPESSPQDQKNSGKRVKPEATPTPSAGH